MARRNLLLALSWMALSLAAPAYASPPLGLTQIRNDSESRSKLAVIDGVAYVSSTDGVYPVDFSGAQSPIVPSHSLFGSLESTSRVVKATNGKVHVAANFDRLDLNSDYGSADFELSQPTVPVITWENIHLRTIGLDKNLRSVGNSAVFVLDSTPKQLFPNGAIGEFSGMTTVVHDIEPGGYVLGNAVIPGTIGSAPFLIAPNGDAGFLESAGTGHSISRRQDGKGINLGYDVVVPYVIYGDTGLIEIDRSIGGFFDAVNVLVSESDFVIVESDRSGHHLAYFPGINPAGPDRSVGLLDYFPELLTLDFENIVDIASEGGQIHLLLSGDDGLWLFAAPDPTAIPEPSAVLLTLVAGFFAWRRRAG